MKLGFVENDPTAWSAVAAVEWSRQRASNYRTGQGVARCRSRRNDELAIDNLAHDMIRQTENVLVGSRLEAAAAKTQTHGTTTEPNQAQVQSPAASATIPAAAQGNPATAESNLVGTPAATPAPEGNPWQHTAKWVATSAAVAFLALGVVEHARYYGNNSDYNNARCAGSAYCNGVANSADTAKTWTIAGYSAAAVATGAAIAFWRHHLHGNAHAAYDRPTTEDFA